MYQHRPRGGAVPGRRDLLGGMAEDNEDAPQILDDVNPDSQVDPPLTPAYHKHDIQMVTVNATLANEVSLHWNLIKITPNILQ